MEKELTRICQICEKVTLYKSKKTYTRACKENRNCFLCSTRLASNNLSDESRYKIGSSNRGKCIPQRVRDIISKKLTGIKRGPLLPEHRRKVSEASIRYHSNPLVREMLSKKLSGENNPMYGKHHTQESKILISNAWKGRKHTQESKEKMRQSRIEYMKTHQINYGISKSETLFLNEIESRFKIKFEKRQFYLGGRYYDAKYNNCLIEVDGKYWHIKDADIEEIKNRIAIDNGYNLYRFEVNSVKEVENRLLEYKNKIDEFISLK